jgi:hypothetical protein
MANGFDYESPLNKLLGVTIPQFLNQQLDRQESSRRFDEQMLAQAADRRQRQANFDRQQSLLEEQNQIDRQRQDQEDMYDIDSGLIDRITSETNLDKRSTLATNLRGQFKTERGVNELEAIMTSTSNDKEDRQSNLDLFKEIGILNDKEYTVLSKNTSSPQYEAQLNTTINRSMNQANLDSDREFQAKFADVKFIQSKIIQLQRDRALTVPGSTQRISIDDEVARLNSELGLAKESLNQYFGGQSGAQGSGNMGGESTAGMTTLKGGGKLPTAIYNQFILGESEDIPQEYYTTFNDEDYDDLVAASKLSGDARERARQAGVASVPTTDALSPKELAMIRKRRQREEALGSIDYSGQETGRALMDFLRNIRAPKGSMTKPAG